MTCLDCTRDARCIKHNFMARVPDAINYWDFSRNRGVNPYLLAPSSMQKAWFCCPSVKNCGHHVWETTLNRFSAGTRCPFCLYRKLCPCTAAWTAIPNLQLYWDFSRNRVSPEKISVNYQKVCFFRCINGHEWVESIRCFRSHPHCPDC